MYDNFYNGRFSDRVPNDFSVNGAARPPSDPSLTPSHFLANVESETSIPPPDGSYLRRRRRPKMELPLTVWGAEGMAMIMTNPDSDSEENITFLQIAQHYGWHIERNLADPKEFQLGNGKVVKAIGRTNSLECSFLKNQRVALIASFMS